MSRHPSDKALPEEDKAKSTGYMAGEIDVCLCDKYCVYKSVC